jgi:signal transduction histidine kinase/ligand-binding sensor domain-containing protein
MRIRSAIPTALIILAVHTPAASALDRNFRITQYRHTAWRVQDGAFESAPNAIAQTTDGFIWIGTNSGLVRHDGVRFVPWRPPNGKRDIGAVYSLLGSSDGTLWIGTADGLFSWKNNDLTEHISYRINSILEDRDHRIWVARSRVFPPSLGGICQVTDGHSECMGGDDQTRLHYAQSLAQDAQGNLWIGADLLMRWNNDGFASFFGIELEPFRGLGFIDGIAAAKDGPVWVAIPRKGLGLFQIVHGAPVKYELPNAATEQAHTLFVDHDNSLWVGTINDGIYRVQSKRIDHFGSEDGLSSNLVNSFYQDREGNLWVASSKGLDCFRNNRVVTFSRSEGLAADFASSVLSTDDGSVWIGNRGSLDRLHDGEMNSIPIPGRRVTSLWQDRAKQLWVGVDNQLTIYDSGNFRRIPRPDGSPLGIAKEIIDDNEQNVWVATAGPENRLFRIKDQRVQEEVAVDKKPPVHSLAADPKGGIWLRFANSLGQYRAGRLDTFPLKQVDPHQAGSTIDPDRSLWIPTTNGIVRWKDLETKTISSANGLPCDAMYSAIRDNESNLWIYARCGLIRIADAELQRWWKQPDTIVKFEYFDVLDGAMPALSTFRPAVSKSPDGRLWFANDAVVQMVDPNRFQQSQIPPPVYIEQLRADQKGYVTQSAIRLPPHSHDIEITYTALSFAAPEKVRFRYKLDGRDPKWQDAGVRRQAFFSDLPHGHYSFHVTAANNDEVWTEKDASLSFSIDPAWYETRWFQAACLALVLAGIWTGYHHRSRQLAHDFSLRLEERVRERTRLARDLHDTLLQSFQGLMLHLQGVNDQLPEGKAKQQLRQTIERAEAALDEGRTAVYDLRSFPPTRTNLTEDLKQLGEELSAGGAASFHLEVVGVARALQSTIRDEIYRIVQEALRNAFKHAHACRVTVEVNWGKGKLLLRVRDDGRGIPAEILEAGRVGHCGLHSMRERAGQIAAQFEIMSGAGMGTDVVLNVPASAAYAPSTWRSLYRLITVSGPKNRMPKVRAMDIEVASTPRVRDDQRWTNRNSEQGD